MEQRIELLSGSDAEDVAAKRKWVLEHYEPAAQHHYETIDGKLRLLDTILRNKWIEKSERLKLQCLGIIFGDALAQEVGLTWVTIEDEYGRDPALVLPGTSIKVFPLTMISKRVEAGEQVDVYALFRITSASIMEIRRNLEQGSNAVH